MNKITLQASDLAAYGYTPQEFLFQISTGEQQRIAAQIVMSQGNRRLAQRLLSHDPNLTEFVVETRDNAAAT